MEKRGLPIGIGRWPNNSREVESLFGMATSRTLPLKVKSILKRHLCNDHMHFLTASVAGLAKMWFKFLGHRPSPL
jgi:hypothetical protein